MDINNWKGLSQKLLITLRTLFVATLTWDFFLTVVIKTSARAHVLQGMAAPFAPFVVIVWLITIIGLSLLLLDIVFNKTADDADGNRKYTAYGLLILSIFLYVILAVLAFVNPIVIIPVIINFIVNLAWAVALLYFRIKFYSLSKSEISVCG